MMVQVTKVRKYRQAKVIPISQDGSQVPRKRTLAVCFPEQVFSEVDVGTVWEVRGDIEPQTFTVNDWEHTEDLLVAESAKFLRLSGDVLAFYLAQKVEGVGPVIASRVARTEGIEKIIVEQDIERLCQIKGVDSQRAYSLIRCWPDSAVMEAIEWVQSVKMSPHIGRRMIDIFGPQAIATVRQSPFVLLALGVPWPNTLALAESLGFGSDSPETLCAIVERAAANLTRDTGDIAIDEQALKIAVSKLTKQKIAIEHLVNIAVSRRALIRVGKHGLVPIGAALIEDTVARALTKRIQRRPGAGTKVAQWECLLTMAKVQAALARFESTLPFELTIEQREAVVGAVMSPVACISGGAGTGKTTILQAVLGVYQDISRGLTLKQVALSGRAAQRMAESTGHEACTIAKLIAEHLGDKKEPLPPHVLLVIDEASMIDLLSMYRLCSILPDATRILFVGDVAQLPPVGPGLIFHSLTKPGMPLRVFHLSQVKRQDSESGIHRFATAIRNGESYSLPLAAKRLSDSPDAALATEMTVERAYALWCQAGGRERAVMLSPVRKGNLGVDNLNAEFQKREGHTRRLVKSPHNALIEWRNSKGQWLFEGDPIMVSQNDYILDVRNGDLGYVQEVFDTVDEDGAVGVVVLDSGPMPLTIPLLTKIELAYAITVHKSQGSQWPVVIMTLPPEASRMTDRTLLYTGATRPTERLVIMGEQSVINGAVSKGNVALKRKVCLGGLVAQYCEKGFQ